MQGAMRLLILHRTLMLAVAFGNWIYILISQFNGFRMFSGWSNFNWLNELRDRMDQTLKHFCFLLVWHFRDVLINKIFEEVARFQDLCLSSISILCLISHQIHLKMIFSWGWRCDTMFNIYTKRCLADLHNNYFQLVALTIPSLLLLLASFAIFFSFLCCGIFHLRRILSKLWTSLTQIKHEKIFLLTIWIIVWCLKCFPHDQQFSRISRVKTCSVW